MRIFDGKRFFVYGNGLSGKAAARAIRRNGGKARIYTDKNGVFDAPPELEYVGAIVSPGIRRDHAVYKYCAERGIPTMGEAELGFKLADRPIAAVTGTNGKTTVTRLTAAMLGCPACGNIGLALTDALEQKSAALVCELSSFQLCDAHGIKPAVAVITNTAPDHIDWHGSYEEYCRCKCNIAAEMDGGYLILGDDVAVGALATLSTKAKILRCSTEHVVDGAYILGDNFWFAGERVCPTDYLRLQGRHNLKNALCAIAAAKCMGASNSDILTALSAAESEPHRIAYVGCARGKRWIDDSKSTNIPSTLAAIAAQSGKICLILGGRNKGLDFTPLFESELMRSVVEVIAMGECAHVIELAAVSRDHNVKTVRNLKDAVRAAARSDAETVLLSPACASFDEFDNYGQRGDVFKAEVGALRDDK